MFPVTDCPYGPCGRQATLEKKKTVNQASKWNSFKGNVEETWTNAGPRARRLYMPAEIQPAAESKGPGLYLNETERGSQRSCRINVGDSGLCCCAVWRLSSANSLPCVLMLHWVNDKLLLESPKFGQTFNTQLLQNLIRTDKQIAYKQAEKFENVLTVRQWTRRSRWTGRAIRSR